MEIHAVPQRQGAVVHRSTSLPAGCLALADFTARLLGVPVRRVPVRAGSSPTTGFVANRQVLLDNRQIQLSALRAANGPVLTIGGDCGVETVALGAARRRFGSSLGVAWFDAHADLNIPATSPSFAFHGMALRAALGEGDRDFVVDPAVDSRNVVLVGTRSFDPAEQALVDRRVVRHVPVQQGWQPDWVAAELAAARAQQVYLHIDLDVLDPLEFGGACCPEPVGLQIDEVVAAIYLVAAEWPVVGAGITECATDDPAALRALTPLLVALGEVLTTPPATLA